MIYSEKEREKLELEIYLIFRSVNGSITTVSGLLGKNDSSELSRSLNPNDIRRNNFVVLTLEVLGALTKFAPLLEEEIWAVMERERKGMRKGVPDARKNVAEHINNVFAELQDVVFANNTGASQQDLEKEAFELLKAAENQYEAIKERKQ